MVVVEDGVASEVLLATKVNGPPGDRKAGGTKKYDFIT